MITPVQVKRNNCNVLSGIFIESHCLMRILTNKWKNNSKVYIICSQILSNWVPWIWFILRTCSTFKIQSNILLPLEYFIDRIIQQKRFNVQWKIKLVFNDIFRTCILNEFSKYLPIKNETGFFTLFSYYSIMNTKLFVYNATSFGWLCH